MFLTIRESFKSFLQELLVGFQESFTSSWPFSHKKQMFECCSNGWPFHNLLPSPDRISAAQPEQKQPLHLWSHLWLWTFSSPALCLHPLPVSELRRRYQRIKSWKFHKNRESLLHYYVHYFMRRPHHNKMWKKFSKIWLHVHQYQCKPVTFVKPIWAMTLWLSGSRSQNNLLIVNCLISAGMDAQWEFYARRDHIWSTQNQIKSPGRKLSAGISTHLFSAPVD